MSGITILQVGIITALFVPAWLGALGLLLCLMDWDDEQRELDADDLPPLQPGIT